MNMNIPKQYIEVAGRMIITESIRPFMESGMVSDIRIVADAAWHDNILDEYRILSQLYIGDLVMNMGETAERYYPGEGLYKFSGFSEPGDNRQLSILNALRDIKSELKPSDSAEAVVIIHDAARPLISAEMIEKCILAMEEHDGVMPVLPMKDTVYYSEDGNAVSKLLNRDKIFAGQAPEVFRFNKYLSACETLLPDKIMEIRGSTEPAILAGMDIVMIPGDAKNFKITTKDDLERYIDIFKEK